jgi:hypothetical protein
VPLVSTTLEPLHVDYGTHTPLLPSIILHKCVRSYRDSVVLGRGALQVNLLVLAEGLYLDEISDDSGRVGHCAAGRVIVLRCPAQEEARKREGG